ncbi:hypothetical protein MRX96_033174 [Rhipicephalus microplus]
MSCSGLAPPPPFLLCPGDAVVPWEQWQRMFETYLLAPGATEFHRSNAEISTFTASKPRSSEFSTRYQYPPL